MMTGLEKMHHPQERKEFQALQSSFCIRRIQTQDISKRIMTSTHFIWVTTSNPEVNWMPTFFLSPFPLRLRKSSHLCQTLSEWEANTAPSSLPISSFFFLPRHAKKIERGKGAAFRASLARAHLLWNAKKRRLNGLGERREREGDFPLSLFLSLLVYLFFLWVISFVSISFLFLSFSFSFSFLSLFLTLSLSLFLFLSLIVSVCMWI